MTYTSNYNLNIVEGTDIVNPLTQLNPNFTSIDSIMKSNADASVTPATCIKSGTVHTVTRTNTSAEMFVFTATGDWNTGDTMTVDGTPVTPVLPDGTALLTGSYLINAEVLCSIKGTKVTVYSNKLNLPTILASDVEYAAGVSVKDMLDAASDKQIIAGNSDYVTGSLNYIKFGKMVILNSRFTIHTEKPSGQSNYLFTGLPIPSSVVPVCTHDMSKLIIVNSSGELTSNLAVPAGTYNIFAAYVEN